MVKSFGKFYSELVDRSEFNQLEKSREKYYKALTTNANLRIKLKILLKTIRIVYYIFFKKICFQRHPLKDPRTIFFDLGRQQLGSVSGINEEFERFLDENLLHKIRAPSSEVYIIGSEYKGFFPTVKSFKSYLDFLSSGSNLKSAFRIFRYMPIIIYNIFNSEKFYFTILDLIEIYLFSDLNNQSADYFIATNSSLHFLPSIFFAKKHFRKYKTTIVLYSENNFVEGTWDDEILNQNLFVDEVFVWTEEYKKYLISLNRKSQIHAIGTITFQLKSTGPVVGPKNLISVLDIIPAPDLEGSVYSAENGINFLIEIAKFKYELQRNHFEVNIILKHARRILNSHNREYLGLIEILKSNNILDEYPWSENIYNLVNKSSLVITPYGTSAALIARELKIPVYYLCTDLTFKSGLPLNYKIPLINNSNQLIQAFLRS